MFGVPPLPRTLEAAFRDLQSERADVRIEAIGDLIRHQTQEGDEGVARRAVPLLQRLLSDPEASVRSAAASALGTLRAGEALSALLVASEDEATSVRQMALMALGELRDPRCLGRLERGLRDTRADVRYQALLAYCHVAADDGEAVADVLLGGLLDADPSIRYLALRIAEERLESGPPIPHGKLEARVGELLSDANAVALVAALFLVKQGIRGGGEVPSAEASTALPGGTSSVLGRGKALRDEAGKALREVIVTGKLHGRRPDKEDEQEAVELAGILGFRDLIPVLEKRAWGVMPLLHDTCSWHAKIALAALGHDRALREFDRNLASARREEVESAVVALGRARRREFRDRIAKLTARTADPVLVEEALRLLSEPRG